MLTVRVPATNSEPAAAFVAAVFPGAQLREAHGGRLRFQLPTGGHCALAHVFGELATQGAEHGVEDFSVSQTTLEEVPTASGRVWGQGWGCSPALQADLHSCPLGPLGCPPARCSCTSLRTRGRRRRTKTSRRQEWGWTPGQACRARNSSPGSWPTPAWQRQCCEPAPLWGWWEALGLTKAGQMAWS